MAPMDKSDQPKGNDAGDGRLVHELYSREEMNLFDSMKIKGGAKLENIPEFWLLACLRARKYDPNRAIELAVKYMEWRIAFDVEHQTPRNNNVLLAQLQSGMIRIPGTKDKLGRYLVVMDLSKHDPDKWNSKDTVRCLHYNLARLLQQFPEAQARGIVVLNDMTHVTLKNIDTSVPKEVFNALSSRFPIRLGGIYIVNPPWFFRAVFPIVRTFMKKKFQERVRILRGTQGLQTFFDNHQLLMEHGGIFNYDHDETVRLILQE